ncbi:hypothetical protein ES704_00740 [subsurface metagenome]|jgi:hypothetical protein
MKINQQIFIKRCRILKRQGDISLVIFQEYIFILLNRLQRLKELVFFNFSTP